MRRTVLFSIVAALAVLPAAAATLRVPSEYPTINAALSASVAGDTVLVAPGTYDEYEIRDLGGGDVASCAFLEGGVVVLSEAGPGVTTIEMQGAVAPWTYVVMAYYLIEETIIEGFTIAESQPNDGKMYVSSCPKVTIRSCVFRDMADDGSGGALCASYADLEIAGCQFINCHAARGGGIWQYDGQIVIEDSWFEGCSYRAVGLMGEQGINPESVEVRRCHFAGNSADYDGGGVWGSGINGPVLIAGCVFEGNAADAGGGAASVRGTTVLIRENVFVENWATSAAARGGALNVRGDALLENNTFYRNGQIATVWGGAAVVFKDGNSQLRNNIVVGSQGGPAIRLSSGSVTSSCNVFWENEGGIGDGYTPGPTDQEANPLFCDPENGDLSLAENSPCLPPQSGACGLIGALGEGCGVIAIEPTSWSKLKGRYR